MGSGPWPLAQSPAGSWETWEWGDLALDLLWPMDLLCSLGKSLPLSGPGFVRL